MADKAGQQVLSPYRAMACNPAVMVDPFGLRSSVFDNGARSASAPVDPLADIKAMFPTINMYLPGGSLFNAGNMARNSMMEQTLVAMEALKILSKIHQALGWAAKEGASGSKASGNAGEIGQAKDKRNGGNLGAVMQQQEVRATVNVVEIGYAVMNNTVTDKNGMTYTESGVEAQFGITGATYNEYQWLQTIETSSPQIGKTSPYLDEAHDNSFFYNTASQIQDLAADLSRLNLNAYFYDGSTRDTREGNVRWSAQLTLVGRMEGGQQWSPVLTIQWGWNRTDGVVTPVPWSIFPFNSSRNQSHLNTRNSSPNP